MTSAAPSYRPFRCPSCGRTVLYLDGESSPRLICDETTREPIACEGCFGRKRAPSAPPLPKAPKIAPEARARVRPTETRPVRRIVQDDVGAVVGLLYEGLDALDAVRKFLRKLKG